MMHYWMLATNYHHVLQLKTNLSILSWKLANHAIQVARVVSVQLIINATPAHQGMSFLEITVFSQILILLPLYGRVHLEISLIWLIWNVRIYAIYHKVSILITFRGKNVSNAPTSIVKFVRLTFVLNANHHFISWMIQHAYQNVLKIIIKILNYKDVSNVIKEITVVSAYK